MYCKIDSDKMCGLFFENKGSTIICYKKLLNLVFFPLTMLNADYKNFHESYAVHMLKNSHKLNYFHWKFYEFAQVVIYKIALYAGITHTLTFNQFLK